MAELTELLRLLKGDITAQLSIVLIALVVLMVALTLSSRFRRKAAPAPPPAMAPRPHTTITDDRDDLLASVAELKADNRDQTQVLSVLLDFAKEMTKNREKREVAPLLRRVLQYLFEPEDVLIFYKDKKGEQLVLAHRSAISPGPKIGTRINFGEGHVGRAAESQVTMNDTDFATQARYYSQSAPALGEAFQNPNLCAPMVNENDTYGVIALYGMNIRRKNEKPIIKFVADLGATTLRIMDLINHIKLQANEDGLTNLHNKRSFLAELGEKLDQATVTNAPLSLLLFDVDHFKNYNDVNGHLAGDEALKITGRLLKENLRADDIAARFGGEEFVVLLSDVPKDKAIEAGEKLRRLIEEYPYPHEERQPLGRLTISGGVACYPEDGPGPRELIAAADEALYRAKRAGRNRVLVHEHSYLSAAEEGPAREDEDSFVASAPSLTEPPI